MGKSKTSTIKNSNANRIKNEEKESSSNELDKSNSDQKKNIDIKKDEKNKEVTVENLLKSITQSLVSDPVENASKTRNEVISEYLKQTINKHEIAKKYNILILYDEGRMIKSDADHIYSAATKFSERKPILLVLYSTGGMIDSAYLIGKLCREYSSDGFIVTIPRQAKSAATLICCAADEIHMGSLSELGPIDPQIDQLPALGLKSSIEHLADLISRYPKSSEMFAKYLHLSLEPIHLGYYERVAESAAQYAERLLKSHYSNLKSSPEKISNDLVYSYKDHGFVIDKSEALDIFGNKVIKSNTEEYDLGNSIYGTMKLISSISELMRYSFYFIGSSDSEPNFNKKSNR